MDTRADPISGRVDIRPPAIYLLHALPNWSFGWQQWAIRVSELMAVLAVGGIAAKCVRRPAGESAVGQTGVVVLITTVWYYTSFDYWDTAQVELWEGLAVLCSYAVLSRCRTRLSCIALAGAAFGVALLFKFTAGVMVLPHLLLLREALPAGSVRTRAARWTTHSAVFAAGASIPLATTLAYFGTKTAGLSSMYDVLVGFNSYYVNHWAADWNESLALAKEFLLSQSQPVGGIVLTLWVLAVWRARSRGRVQAVRESMLAGGFLVTGMVSVAIQRKFFPYHWGILTPGVALLAGYAVAESARVHKALPAATGLLALTSSLLAAPPSNANPHYSYVEHMKGVARYFGHAITRSTYLAPFTGMYGYDYEVQEALGLAVRSAAGNDSALQVMGFEPALYVVSGLRAPTRFPATHFLTDPALAYRREEWRSEFERQLVEQPPRFIVVLRNDRVPLAELEDSGYVPRIAIAQFLLLERGPQAPLVPPPLPSSVSPSVQSAPSSATGR